MGIRQAHNYAQRKFRNLFGDGGEILVELRYKRVKDTRTQVYRVRCLKGKAEDKYVKYNDDGTIKEVFRVDMLIEDLLNAEERRSGDKDCITENFRDVSIFVGSKQYVVLDQKENGNFNNIISLILERVV